MPPTPATTREQILFVDQDHPLADFEFNGLMECYQSPAPFRLLLALSRDIRPGDLRYGMRLAVRLGWRTVEGKRWRHVQVLRVIPPAGTQADTTAAGSMAEVEPTSFSAFLDRAPRSDRAGGARGAVGRKRLATGDATEAHSITLPASAWRLLERLGNGNRSEGVRRMVDKYAGEASEGPG